MNDRVSINTLKDNKDMSINNNGLIIKDNKRNNKTAE